MRLQVKQGYVYIDLGIFSNVSKSFCLKDQKPVTLDQPTIFLAS